MEQSEKIAVYSIAIKTAYLPYAMAGVLLTMGITFAFSRYELKHGKEIESPRRDGQNWLVMGM